MANSLEFSVETFFIELFKADSRSAGKEIAHFDEDTTGKSNAIVIRAQQGAHNLAAFGGFDLEVEITYRAPIKKASKAEKDAGAKMLTSIVYESTVPLATRAAMATAAGLSDLVIKDEASGDRSNSENLRKRTISLPIQAKLT